MSIYFLQRIYDRANNRTARLAMIRAARAFGMRTLAVRMDINNYCNIRCVICITRYREEGPRHVMPLDDFRRIAADLFPRTRLLYLSCGFEALAVRNFPDYLAQTRRHRVPFVAFATNGMLLTEDISRAVIEHGVSEITVSADGATAETYEFIRTGARFSRLLENLARLREMKRRAGTTRPALRMNFTYLDRNVAEIPAFIETFAPLGMKTLELRPMLVEHESLRGLFTDRAKAELARLLPEIERACRARGVQLLAPLAYEAAADQPGGRRRARFPGGKNACVLPYLCAYVDAYGNFKPCPGGPHELGNLTEQTYEEILRSERVRAFLDQVRGPNPLCEGCNFS